jgi:peptidoglycan/LPS O-acetylase OafA/YrhL
VEVQFYVLAPIFANVFLLPKSVRRIILIGLVSFGDLTRTVGAIIPHTTILDFYQFFLVGLLLADFYVSGDLEGSNEILSCFIAVLGFGLIWVGSERGLALRIGMFCFCAFRSRIIRNLVSVQWVTVIGGMCYSMYLLDHGLISIFGRFLARQFRILFL